MEPGRALERYALLYEAGLVAEALPGQGAILLNGMAERFMVDVPPRELSARDIVARALSSRSIVPTPVETTERDIA